MENIDTLSSCSSNLEEISLASSLSGMSNYNEEFVQLRHLINPKKYSWFVERSKTPTNIDNNITNCQDLIKVQQNHDRDIDNIKTNIELSFHDTIEKLIRSKNQLEIQLENANSQIERLMTNFGGKNKPTDYEKRIIMLEEVNYKLNSTNAKLESNLVELRCKVEELESKNVQLNVKLADLEIDNETKLVCIKELKEKIKSQHIQNEKTTENWNSLRHQLEQLQSELELKLKSEEWYKKQLTSNQYEKEAMFKENCDLKTKVETLERHLREKQLEFSQARSKFDTFFHKSITEKENLPTPNIVDNNIDAQSLLNHYEMTIQDLYKEINHLKLNVKEREDYFEGVIKENSTLMGECLKLQKILQQNEMELERVNSNAKELSEKYKMVTENQRKFEFSEEKLSLENKVSRLETELKNKDEENQLIEKSVKTIRAQFGKFKLNYMQMKNELNEKNKTVLQMETEKQKLFMNNNWNMCELEKMKEKDIEIGKLQNLVQNAEEAKSKLLDNIKQLHIRLDEKDSLLVQTRVKQNQILLEKTNEINKYDNVLVQYKKTVDNYQDEINNLKRKINDNEFVVIQLKDNVKILKDEIKKRDFKLKDEKEKNKLWEEKLGDKNVLRIVDQLKELGVNNVNGIKHLLVNNNTRNESIKNENEEIQNLKTLVKVKELEIKEKQKKYETNNRTLLRKVKEHMKGRHSAEKQNSYLQTMFNELSEEFNSFKLISCQKENEIKDLKKSIDIYKNINENLKETVLKLEKEAANSGCDSNYNHCDHFEELELIRKNVGKQLTEKIQLEKQLQDFSNKINILENERDNYMAQINKYEKERDLLCIQLSNLETKLQNNEDELKITKNINDKHKVELENNYRCIQTLNEKNEFLNNEIKILKELLKEKDININTMDANNKQLEQKWLNTNEEMHKTVENFRKLLHSAQNNNNILKSEKFFLQRISNDLKIALESHIRQNKVLKEQISLIDKDSFSFNSLPNILPANSSQIKYDDEYIHRLLNENKTSLNTLTQFQESLSNLKEEIYSIQEKVFKNNAERST